jgi:5'-3' exoribonuclease 2
VQGLEWTMKYYTTGCPNWRWTYKYNYPPLLQDLLLAIPTTTKEFIRSTPSNPVNELVQLCYVLPRPSLYLLPSKLHFELIRKYNHWYKIDCEFVWAYCRYFWESHVEMHKIDICELERIVQTIVQ